MNFDRRRFLLGAGGAVLTLPLLESLWPRRVLAQAMTPPKRLVILSHSHGMPVFDQWQPAVTGTFPTDPNWSISPILSPLDSIRDKVLVLSGISNAVRAAPVAADGDNHVVSQITLLTAMPPSDATSGANATGPSIDFVIGQRLGQTEYNNIVLFASTDDPSGDGPAYHYSSVANQIQLVSPISGSPRVTATNLFASIAPTMAPTTPTLADRLHSQRGSILDGVASQLTALRNQLPAEDRARLDAHEANILTLEQRYAMTATQAGMSCSPPNPSTLPDFPASDWNLTFGVNDNITAPAQVDNIVTAFACDITRSAALRFQVEQSPCFPWLYGGDTSVTPSGFPDWHGMVHEGGADTTASGCIPSPADRLANGFNFYAQVFAYLINRLSTTMDASGTPLLDNTLVVWISEFGDGGNHNATNLPVILAGLGSAFPKGQYVDYRPTGLPTTGDLYTTMLQLLGQPDTSFGLTGTLAAEFWALPGFVVGSPYNNGPLAL